MLMKNNSTLKSLWDSAVNSARVFSDFVFGDEKTPGHVRLLNMDIVDIDTTVRRLMEEAQDNPDVMEHTLRSLIILVQDNGILAMRDSLTGLHNRPSIDEHVGRHLERMERGLVDKGALIYADLDRFKNINDTLGHDAGDQAIITAAQTIAKTVRTIDVPARRGGDEFVVFLPDVTAEQAQAALQRLQKAFETLSFKWENQQVPIRGSFGLAAIEHDEKGNVPTLEQAFAAADHAMYAVKENKRANGYAAPASAAPDRAPYFPVHSMGRAPM